MQATEPTHPELDSPRDVLAFVRARRADANAAELDVLTGVVTWAEQHPPESIYDMAAWPGSHNMGTETGLALAGEGAPQVAEFCLAELGAALGVSTDAARLWVAHGIELKYRLPRLHGSVTTGRVPVWRARRVAEQTLSLTPEAAAFVDAQVAGFAQSISVPALERLVAEAIARFMPDRALDEARAAADRRRVTFHHHQVSLEGTTMVEAELDLADALDLDAAITRGADALRQPGAMSPSTYAVRWLPVSSPAISSPSTSAPLTTRATLPRRRVEPPSRARWCSTCTSRSQPSPAPPGPWMSHGWRTTSDCSPLSRSRPGAPTPTPRSS